MEAALKGSKQIAFTIISLTFSLVAVLIPLLFMGDVVGRLFREFAITLAVAILISAFVSLTLTPMMCRAAAQAHAAREAGQVLRARPANGSTASSRATARRCDWVLAHQSLTLMVFLVHAGAHGAPLHRDPEGLLPAAGHRPHPGHLRGAAVGVLRRRCRERIRMLAAGPPRGAGGGERVDLHRRGRPATSR